MIITTMLLTGILPQCPWSRRCSRKSGL